MNKNFERPALGLCLAALVATSFGCDQQAFNTINGSLNQLKGSSPNAADARLTTMAAATALSGLELMKALSKPSGAKKFRVLDLTAGTGKNETIDENGVKATVQYDSVMQGSTIVSTIKAFEGKTSGYDITAKGEFRYTPAAKGSGGILGTVEASMEGELSRADLKVKLRKLTFATQDPIPADLPKIGELILDFEANKSITTLMAVVGFANGKVKGEATTRVDGKEVGTKISIGEGLGIATPLDPTK